MTDDSRLILSLIQDAGSQDAAILLLQIHGMAVLKLPQGPFMAGTPFHSHWGACLRNDWVDYYMNDHGITRQCLYPDIRRVLEGECLSKPTP